MEDSPNGERKKGFRRECDVNFYDACKVKTIIEFRSFSLQSAWLVRFIDKLSIIFGGNNFDACLFVCGH
jgi:hypothetical protein